MFDWAKEMDCAITVCDKEGIVLYQNEKSIVTNGDVLNQNLFGCHNPRSQEIIRRLINEITNTQLWSEICKSISFIIQYFGILL